MGCGEQGKKKKKRLKVFIYVLFKYDTNLVARSQCQYKFECKEIMFTRI